MVRLGATGLQADGHVHYWSISRSAAGRPTRIAVPKEPAIRASVIASLSGGILGGLLALRRAERPRDLPSRLARDQHRPPDRRGCRRARGRQGQGERMRAGLTAPLTAAARGGFPGSGRGRGTVLVSGRTEERGLNEGGTACSVLLEHAINRQWAATEGRMAEPLREARALPQWPPLKAERERDGSSERSLGRVA
jgi:hypothetical protein